MMILLEQSSMSLITPEPGLIFWTTLIFATLWFLLAKFAFEPIASALKDREDSIQEALDSADKAKAEMASLQADNDRIIQEARAERMKIVQEAKEEGSKMVAEARDKAKLEANKIIASATSEIESQKMAAMTEVKNIIGTETVKLAEQILRTQLKDKESHLSLIDREIQNISLN